MKTIECVVNGVKVEAGQWWMMRSGAITYIVGVNPFDEDEPINAYDNMSYNVYTRDGKFSKSATSRHDLHRHLQFCTGFDWAGDGYRLLNVETDVVALGDERWNNHYYKWEHRSIFHGSPFGKNCRDFYRRKIAVDVPAPSFVAKPSVDPGEGYRLLSDDEPVIQGDEHSWDDGLNWHMSLAWKPVSEGGSRSRISVYRRKLPAPRTETEYYIVPNAVNIAYIFRTPATDAKFQTVLKTGKWCVAFDQMHTGWKKCTQQEAHENLTRMNFKPRYFVNYKNWVFTAYAVQKEYKGICRMVDFDGNDCTSLRCPLSIWTEVTEQKALSRLHSNHPDDDDLEEDDDDFADLSDADDEDYDDDDRVQEPQNVTINITVNVFPAFEEYDEEYDDEAYHSDLSVNGVHVGKCSVPVVSNCCGCGSSAGLSLYNVKTATEPVNARQQGGVTGGTPSPNPGAGYRLIDKNVDTPKGGDQYWDHTHGWKKRAWDGCRFTAVDTYRRKVDPDPGVGYRLIDQSVDTPNDGDEYWSFLRKRWEPRVCLPRPFSSTGVYRRKVEPAEPVCEAGYRWMVKGEVIEATDQFQDIFDKQWKNPLVAIGEKTVNPFKWRRPIKPEPAPVEYRTLQVGEVIEKGDEFKFLQGWIQTTRAGDTIMPDDKGEYRRKIDPTKDRYFVWGDGFSCYKLVYPDGTVHSVWRDGSMNESCINPLKPDTHDSEFLEVSKDFAEAAIRNR